MTDKYFVARDANTIAKFVGRMAAYNYKFELYRINGGDLPRPVSKSSKYPAYEAAGRIERTLKLETRAGSVPELSALVGKAIAYLNSTF